MIRTLRTYVGQKAVCERARRWFADRSVLTKTRPIRRGHYEFVLHIPSAWDEAKARIWLATALNLGGEVHYEPPVYEEAEGETHAERTARLRVASRAAHDAANAPAWTIHERIAEQVDLAKTYAIDGAFRTAARVLRNLADEIDRHDEATRLT